MSAFLLIKYTKPNDMNNINSPAAKIAPYEKVNIGKTQPQTEKIH